MARGDAGPEGRSVLMVSAGTDEPVAPLRLGQRIREIRRARQWTLEEAAQRAGIARSTLSKIENAQMSPSFEAVRRLAHGLGIDIPQLFTPANVDAVSARRTITRDGAGEGFPTATYEHEILCGEIARKRMLPYKTRVRARSFEDFDGWVRHSGEEFLLVLDGAVRFYSEHYAPVDLNRGDSAYYDATMGHCVVSVSARDATILWVTAL